MKKYIPIPDLGVYFVLPKEYAHYEVRPLGRTDGELSDPITKNGKQGGRFVMAFDFVDTTAGQMKSGASDPIELWVQYTFDDEVRARGSDKLTLVWDKGSDSAWIDIPNVEYAYGPPGTGGFAIAKFAIGDPAVGWFP